MDVMQWLMFSIFRSECAGADGNRTSDSSASKSDQSRAGWNLLSCFSNILKHTNNKSPIMFFDVPNSYWSCWVSGCVCFWSAISWVMSTSTTLTASTSVPSSQISRPMPHSIGKKADHPVDAILHENAKIFYNFMSKITLKERRGG